MAEIVYLHGQPQRVAHFLHVGPKAPGRIEHLFASGRLPIGRFIFDAGTFTRHRELIDALRAGGRELSLDTNVAELSSIGRFGGAAQSAPWADPDGVLTPGHFRSGRNQFDIIGKIARFAVQHRVHRVQAPTHFLLRGVKDDWFSVDVESCKALRRSLDIEGGRNVAIDYPLLISNGTLNDVAERKALASAMSGLPIDCVWLRISGFGSSATGAGIRKYIMAAQDFRAPGVPIIADGVGGMAALAIVAFGASSGISHGLAERERFDASDWGKPPRAGGGGGGYMVLFPGIDRLLKRSEAEQLIAMSSARRLVSCNDRECCVNGFEDTMREPKGHYLHQRARQFEKLAEIPEARRVRHFLDTDLVSMDRIARQLSRLKGADPTLLDMLDKNAARLDRVRVVLEDLNKTMGAAAPPATLKLIQEGNEASSLDGI